MIHKRKEQLQEVYKVFDGEQASLRRTCKAEAEAKSNVWILNEDTEKAM